MLLFTFERYQAIVDEIVASMPEASQLDRFLAAMHVILDAGREPAIDRSLVHLWAERHWWIPMRAKS